MLVSCVRSPVLRRFQRYHICKIYKIRRKAKDVPLRRRGNDAGTKQAVILRNFLILRHLRLMYQRWDDIWQDGRESLLEVVAQLTACVTLCAPQFCSAAR